MDSQPQTTVSPETHSKRGRWMGLVITIIVVLLLLGATYVFMKSDSFSQAVPDGAVLASVNGIDITEGDVTARLEQMRTNLEAQGKNLEDPVLRSQTLEEIVDETLVLADAKAKGVIVTGAEIDEQYGQIRARFETEDIFIEELKKDNLTEESLRENIQRGLIINKYIAQIPNIAALTGTEEEIVAFYEQLKGQQVENLPPLEELKGEIETQLKTQKIATAIQGIIAELRSKANITTVNVEVPVDKGIPEEGQ